MSLWGRVFKPKILRRIICRENGQPRLPDQKRDTAVHSVICRGKADFTLFNEHMGHLLEGFSPEDRILVKINLNTADPYPASTDPDTLDGLLGMLEGNGFRNLTVGVCSANYRLPSRRVMKDTPLDNVIRNRAGIVFFDEGKWVNVPVKGECLQRVVIPECVYEADRIIYLANLKTHRSADFSMGMKLAMGFVHPLLRLGYHREHLQEKVVEIMLAVRPDLIFLDARNPFITGGPDTGNTARADQILAGRDLLSVDLEGYRILYRLKQENHCLEGFHADPFGMRQFMHAKSLMEREERP
ncbi:MAG: DUF362 domain-containing protein [Clostridia bacterium]